MIYRNNEPPPLFDRDDDRTIDERFREFDRDHPEVFRLFRELAEKIRNNGWTHYSADAIQHRIRFHFHIEKGEREFKINDHFSSRYARLLISVDPTFEGFFELRRLKS